MTFLDAIILGIVEGITEFLPVSSTGHLILSGELLKIPNSEFLKSFEIAIQLGAILAVVALYWRKITSDRDYIKKVIVACVPTFILGAAAYPFIKRYLLGNVAVVLVSLFVGGIGIILLEGWYKKRMHEVELSKENENGSKVTYRNALLIGTFQVISFIPGVSRAAATILGGMFLKLKRATAAEFSFLLAIPTMGAAVAYDILQNPQNIFGSSFSILATGFLVSAVTAYAVVYYFIRYVQRHDFVGFGWYRIALSIVFALFLFM